MSKIAHFITIITVFVAALWFASCEPDVKSTKVPSLPVIEHPYLTALAVEQGDTTKGNTGATLPLLDSDGKPTEFKPEIFNYKIKLPRQTSLITLKALTEEDFTVKYPYGQILVPQSGTHSLITVQRDEEVTATNYTVAYTQDALPPAILKGILLSTGSITGFDPLVRDYKDIELPYGTKAVTAYPQTDTGAFYTYDPAVTLDFAGGQRTLKISVSMPDYSIGVYTLQFKEKPALESVLAGLTVSSGALTDDAGALPASFDPAAGAATVQYITVTAGTGQVIVNALKQTPADKVVFSDGTLQTEGITCVFSPPYPKTFTVTVNGGEGYSNRAYQFKIQEKTPQSAALANMTFAGIPVYQRAQNGANGASGFAPSYTLYNLNFTNESSVIITAVTPAASGTASYTVEMNGVPQSPARPNEYDITLNSLKASNPPVQITLSGWDATGTALLPTTYSVYLVRSNPPAARLAAGGLAVTGGSVQGQFDPNSGGPYRVNVFAGTQVVLVAATPEKLEFAVTYIPANFIANPVSGSEIAVKVSGGPDYTDTVYTLRMNVLGVQIPSLTTLSVNGTVIPLTAGLLVYNAPIAYGTNSQPVAVNFQWSAGASIARIWYSLDSGANWTEDTQKDGFNGTDSPNFALSPGETRITFIRVRTLDNNESTYIINTARNTQISSYLKALEVSGTDINWQTGSTFQPSKTTYNVWLKGGALTLDTVTPDDSQALLIYILDGGMPVFSNPSPIALSADQSRTLVIRIVGSGSEKTYRLNIKRYQTVWDFTGKDAAQEWKAPRDGIYQFELWGGQGGNVNGSAFGIHYGGKGGYVRAQKLFTAGDTLYVYTGALGKSPVNNNVAGAGAAYGGGGSGGATYAPRGWTGAAGGGGATFVSTANHNDGITNNAVRSGRVLVAGGGGGAATSMGGGHGSGTDIAGSGGNGTLAAGAGMANPAGGIYGNNSGIGTNGRSGGNYTAGDMGNGGGGGGYWGGLAGMSNSDNSNTSGGGGNGFVHTNWTALERKSGNESLPKPDGTGNENGHSGAGFARITNSAFAPPAP